MVENGQSSTGSLNRASHSVSDVEEEAMSGAVTTYPIVDRSCNSGTKESDSIEIRKRGTNQSHFRNWTLAQVYQEFIPSVQVAFPIALANFMQSIVPIISLSFVGQLGETELASVGLALAFSNITGMSIILGSSVACDTLCSQAYGARNCRRVGIIVQRGTLFIGVLCLPIAGLWINSEKVLLGLGQDPEVARLVQVFLTYYIPVLIFWVAFIMIGKLIACQGIVTPLIFACGAASGMNILSNYLLISKLALGIRGGAISSVISHLIMFILLLSIIKFKKYDQYVWKGWSWECLDRWGQYTSLAIPSLLSLAVEWGTYEVGGFIVGLVSNTDVAVHSIIMSVANIAFQIPYGLEMAICIRVANYMGSGDVRRAKMVLRGCLALQICIGVTLAILVYTLRDYIARIFSSDEKVLKLASETMPIGAATLLFDGLQACASGGIKGLGLLKYAFVTNFISYDIIALPMAILLSLKTKLEVKGYWIGMAAAVVCQFSIFLCFLLNVNWSSHSKKARRRAGVLMSLANITMETGDIGTKELLEENGETLIDNGSDSQEQLNSDALTCERTEGGLNEEELNEEELNKEKNEPTNWKPGRGIIIRRLLLLIFCSLLFVSAVVVRIVT